MVHSEVKQDNGIKISHNLIITRIFVILADLGEFQHVICLKVCKQAEKSMDDSEKSMDPKSTNRPPKPSSRA